MSDITPPAPRPMAAALRRLYTVRFVFAIVWAVAVLLTASHLGPLLTVLFVVYPLVDAGAVIWQLRSEGATASPKVAEWINVVLSVLAAIALGVAASTSVSTALAVWGAWAILSGVTQLVTAILRIRTGGQIPLIVSGAISVLAGSGFLIQGLGGAANAVGAGGYAILGGVFFLISAIRLTFVLRKA
jgi:hypothetical protein